MSVNEKIKEQTLGVLRTWPPVFLEYESWGMGVIHISKSNPLNPPPRMMKNTKNQDETILFFLWRICIVLDYILALLPLYLTVIHYIVTGVSHTTLFTG